MYVFLFQNIYKDEITYTEKRTSVFHELVVFEYCAMILKLLRIPEFHTPAYLTQERDLFLSQTYLNQIIYKLKICFPYLLALLIY